MAHSRARFHSRVGALARVTPTFEGGTGPATLIAKFRAPEEGSRFVELVLGMYRNVEAIEAVDALDVV